MKGVAMVFQAASASAKKARSTRNFTIYHGLAASLVLHACICAPFVLPWFETTEEEHSILVFEMDGLLADEQADEKLQQDTAGETQQNVQSATQARMAQAVEQREQTDDGAEASAAAVASPSPTPSKSDPAGAMNVTGAQEQQIARTLSRRAETEEDRIRAYIRQLSKKIHSRLVYPEEGRRTGLRGVAKVSFAILATGQIRQETLKVVFSSGQERLDASALRTVRSSAPFGPPPREMNVAIDVVFGPS